MDWYEHYETALRNLRAVEDSFPDADFRPEGNWLMACRVLGAAQDHIGEVAMHCVQSAYDAGASKKAIADALGFPVSTLRGLKKT